MSATECYMMPRRSRMRFLGGIWLEHAVRLGPLLALYFFLALYHIEEQSLWLDEIITVVRVDSDWSILAPGRWFGGRGPAYPLLVQLWPKWGSVELAFRFLSVLIGGFTVCLSYAMARRLFDPTGVWISTLLFATSPFLIWYSQEARYVVFAMAAGLLSMYLFHLALSTQRISHWFLYCCGVILAIAAFVVNLLLPLVQAVYILCSPARRLNLRTPLLCYSVLFVIFVWWANDGRIDHVSGYWIRLSAYFPTATSTSTVTPQPGPGVLPINTGGARQSSVFELPYTLFAFSTGFSQGPSVRDLQVSRSLQSLLPHALTIAFAAFLFGGLFLAGVSALWRRQPETAKTLVLWLAIPVLGTIAIAAIFPGLAYNVRYVCMAFPPYIFIVAAGIASVQRPTVRLALLATVLSSNAISLTNYYYNPYYAREDARAAAQFLESTAGASDAIVVVGSGLPIRYYYKGALPLHVFNTRSLSGKPEEHLRTLSKEHERIWLVEIRPWQTDPKGRVKAILDQLTSAQQKSFPGVSIYSYRLSQP